MKRFFALMAVVLAVVSCQKDVDNLDVNMGGDVATISVALPADAITRAAADKTNSAWSGLQNEKEEEITVTLYIFDENGVPSVEPYTQTLVENDLVANFEVRLVPGRDYRFVAWAGQVGAEDNFTIKTPNNPNYKDWNIALNNWAAMDESRDAFTGYLVVEDFNSAKTIPTLELTRPFAKLRVITTDMEWITNNNVNPTYAEVSYEVALPSSINAYSQTINYNEPFAKKLHKTFAIKDYTQDANGEMTLFTDYILVPKAGVVKFILNVYEDDSKNKKLITSTSFTTDIPVERNHLTTIKGNILTDGNNINVEVKPGFDEPDVEVDGDIKDELIEAAKSKHYVIDLEGDFIWETGAGHGSNPLIPANAITETLTINGNGYKFIATGTGVGAIRLANGGKLILNDLTVVDQSEYHAENGEVAWEFTYLEFAGETEFNDCVIDNTISLDGTKAVFNNCTFNDKETWPANVGQEYAAWVSNGEVEFNGCEFSGSRGIKVHEAYGSEVAEVVVDNCQFKNLSKKPGMALGTLNADTKVEIKNSTFTNCQPGDQGLYMYETDTDVTTFTFVNENNTVNATVATSEAFAKVLKADIHTLNIALEGDVNVDVAANSTDYYFGGNNTNTITIDGAKVATATGAGDNTYDLTFNHKNSDWNYIRLNNDNAKWVIKNVKLSNSGKNNGPWNRHDISFFNDVVLENVTSDKAIALFGDSDLTNVIISDVRPDNGEAYALWIRPFGQTVNINNCALLAHESKTTDRGIKIDNQYVNEGEAKVTLNVDGLKVKSQKKAAIVVNSKAGADINIKNIDLTEVAADTKNAVWVDSNAKQYAGLVSVSGASMVVEGVAPIAGDTPEEVQTALNTAVTTENAIVQLPAGEYTFPKNFAKGVTVICEEGTVFTGNSKLNINGATVIGATFSNPNGSAVDQTINGTFKNCKFEGHNGLRWCYAGETVIFENCEFSGSTYGIHFDDGANDVIFRNCKISGFNALGAGLTMVTFEGCTFVGNGKSAYNGANLVGSAKLINCEFTFDGTTKTEWIDCKGGSDKTYEFVNCTVNGVKYTAENYQSYKIYSSSDKTVKINGVDCQF